MTTETENSTQEFNLIAALAQSSEELIVPAGSIAVYDVIAGPIHVNKLTNHGLIRLYSSEPNHSTAVIQANEIKCDGSILADLDHLTLLNADAALLSIDATNGSVRALKRIEIASSANLSVNGGIFSSSELHVSAKADAALNVETIDGAWFVDAATASLRMEYGDLHVGKWNIDGDPVYYSYDGNVTFSGPTTNGSLVAVARKDVSGATVNSQFSPIRLAAGVLFNFTREDLPKTGTGIVTDQQCLPSSCIDLVNIQGPSPEGGSITAGTANLTAQQSLIDLQAHAGGSSQGNIDIGALTLPTQVIAKADGHIVVNGNINTPAAQPGAVQLIAGSTDNGFNSAANVQVTGSITVKKGVVFIRAGGNVSTGNIDTSDPNIGTAINIYANLGFADTAPTEKFQVGVAGATNGTGKLDIHTASGNGTNPLTSAGGIHIRNGGSGGMSIDGSMVDASATNSRGGLLLFECPNGFMDVSGTLASSSPQGGFVALLSQFVQAANPATISASATIGGRQQLVWIAAQNVSGDSLTIQCNGDGRNSSDPGSVAIMPQGSVLITDNLDPIHPFFTTTLQGDGLNGIAGPLTVDFLNQLTLNADGGFAVAQISGSPLTVSSGAITATSNGDQTSLVKLFSGTTGGTFSLNGGKITLKSNGATGGTVVIVGDKAAPPTSQVIATANGILDGGNVTLNLTNSDMAGAVTGGFALSATGSAGKGGNVTVNCPDGRLVLSNQGDTSVATADVSALSSGGDAGIINVTAKGLRIPGGANVFRADTAGSGAAGQILVTDTSSLNSALNFNAATASASSADSGKGGTIQVVANSRAVQINGNKMNADAGPNGNADGGSIIIVANGLSVVGGQKISVSAAGSGTGGTIDLEDKSSSDSTPIVIGSQAGQIKLSAPGGSNGGNGGTVKVFSVKRPIIVSGAQVDVPTGGGNGTGGKIFFDSQSDISISGTLDANGSTDATSTGNGGQIAITSGSAAGGSLTISGVLTANSGPAGGNAGAILLSQLATGAPLTIAGTVRANGAAGQITIASAQNLILAGTAKVFANGDSSTVLLEYSDSSGNGSITASSGSNVNANAAGAQNGGTITFLNMAASPNGLKVNHDGLVSATKGSLVFNQPGQPVSVTGSVQFSSGGALIGKVTTLGSTVEVRANNDGDLVFGDVTTDGLVTLTQGADGASIRQANGAVVRGTSLSLFTRGGSVGTNAGGGRFLTEIQTLDADLDITENTGSLFLGNTGNLNVGGAAVVQAGNTVDIRSSGNITVFKSMTASTGILKLNAVNSGAAVVLNGDTSLTAGTGISIATGSAADARLNCPASELNNNGQPKCLPDSIVINGPKEQVFFNGSKGSNNVSAFNATINVGAHTVAFDTHSGSAAPGGGIFLVLNNTFTTN